MHPGDEIVNVIDDQPTYNAPNKIYLANNLGVVKVNMRMKAKKDDWKLNNHFKGKTS